MTDKEIEKVYGNFQNNVKNWQIHDRKAQSIHAGADAVDNAVFGLGALATNSTNVLSPLTWVTNGLNMTDKTYRKFRNDKRITAKSAGHRRAQAHELQAQEYANAAKEEVKKITDEYNTRIIQNKAANYKVDNYNSNLYRR